MKLQLVYNDFGDWQGLYFNGELVYENHKIPYNTLAKYNQELIRYESENVLEEYGVVNEEYEDIPLPKRFSDFSEQDLVEL